MMAVDRAVRSQAQDQEGAILPPEMIELTLMERFHWTPMEIEDIPYKTLQRLFIVMNQRDMSHDAAVQSENKKAAARNKKPRR